ncbi:MAG: tfuA protein [Kiloniellales bacterium]|nr:tfuA protein [Kiloniellales bacterium]
MTVYVFTGPTLPAEDARKELRAEYLPPVSEGDVYRVTLKKPVAIGIIDGYFENVPSVWHKEILYALSRGVHVFGASSMGALRAAELATFGMEGVGAIFQAYRDGHLEDDDEVAVTHGPAELGFPLLSEAMVSIRRTLSDACAANILTEASRQSLESTAKALHYRERTYGHIVAEAAEAAVPSVELERFKSWLPTGRVDQKREDALLMLRTMRDRFKGKPPVKQVQFHFEHTLHWEQATRVSGQGHRPGSA